MRTVVCGFDYAKSLDVSTDTLLLSQLDFSLESREYLLLQCYAEDREQCIQMQIIETILCSAQRYCVTEG